ncbi:MAG: hypothetical protein Q9227_002373 [Pyrenula ochraceoflavens]
MTSHPTFRLVSGLQYFGGGVDLRNHAKPNDLSITALDSLCTTLFSDKLDEQADITSNLSRKPTGLSVADSPSSVHMEVPDLAKLSTTLRGSSGRSEASESQSDLRRSSRKESARTRPDSPPASKSDRKRSRREDERSFRPSSSVYSSASQNGFPGSAAPSVVSTYATADTHAQDACRASESYEDGSMNYENYTKPRADDFGEDNRERKTQKSRRNRSSSRERRSSRRSATKDSEPRRQDNRDTTRRKDAPRSSGKRKPEDGRLESSRALESPTSGQSQHPSSMAFVPTTDQNFDPHIPHQFPGQFPDTTAEPYRPPGLAADYYGDHGESVAFQPGVRPAPPSIIEGAEPHLHEPTIEAAPPAEPSSMGQVGAAASFYANTSDLDVPSPGRPSQPSGSSYPQGPSPRASPEPLPSSSGMNTDYYATGGISTGAGYNFQASQTNGYNESDSSGRPSKPSKMPSSSSNAAVYGTIAAAGAYAASHSSQNPVYGHHHGGNGSQASFLQHRHRHRGPLRRFVDFFKDPEAVAQFEEYSEYVGVCSYCFDPHSSPRDAPRKHHYKQRLSGGGRYGSSTRVDKLSRYASSEDERRRRSTQKSSWATAGAVAGLAGYGLAEAGKSALKRKDFDDTYSIQSGRRMSDENRKSHGHAERDYRKRRSRDDNTDIGITRRSSLSDSRPDSSRIKLVDGDMRSRKSARSRHSRSRSSSTQRRRHAKFVNPSTSYVNLTTESSPGIENFFNASSANSRKSQGKRRKGFFTFNNSSSSSWDADLAFGSGHVRRKKSSNLKERQRRDQNVDAAIVGLGATAAALAAASAHQSRKGKHRADLVAVKDSKNRANEVLKHRNYSRESLSVQEDSDWEDASEDEGSVDSALAFGLSRESLMSNEPEGKAWADKPYEKEDDPRRRPYNVYSPPNKTDTYIRPTPSAASSTSLQQVYPVPTSDPGMFDVTTGRSSVGSVQHQTRPYNVRPGPIPIQQPQPVVPVTSAIYDNAEAASHNYHRHPSQSSVPNTFFPQAPISDSPDQMRRREQEIKPSSKDISRKADESRRDRYQGTPSEPQGSSALSRRSSSKRDRTASVKFDLPEESAEKQRRDRDRERRRAERRRSDSDPMGRSYREDVSPRRRSSTLDDVRSTSDRPSSPSQLEDIDLQLERLKEEEKIQEIEKRRKSSDACDPLIVAGIAGAGAAVTASVIAKAERSDEDDKISSRKHRRKDSSSRKRRAESSEDRPAVVEEDRELPTEKQKKIAKMAASRVKTSPVYDNYSDFFSPEEVRQKSRNTTQIPTQTAVPNIVEVTPASPQPFPADLYRPFGSRPEDDPKMFPWPVPRLGLVQPTPPGSTAGSVRGDETPVIVAIEPPEVEEVEPSPVDHHVEPATESHPIGEEVIYDRTHAPEDIAEVDNDKQSSESSRPRKGSRHRDPGRQSDLPEVAEPSKHGDDLEFAAALAAGAEEAGFDPSIVIDNPEYHRRDPQIDSGRGSIYQAPFVETTSDLGTQIDGYSAVPALSRGFVEGEVESPIEERKTRSRVDKTKIFFGAEDGSEREERQSQKVPGEFNVFDYFEGESPAAQRSDDAAPLDKIGADEAISRVSWSSPKKDEGRRAPIAGDEIEQRTDGDSTLKNGTERQERRSKHEDFDRPKEDLRSDVVSLPGIDEFTNSKSSRKKSKKSAEEFANVVAAASRKHESEEVRKSKKSRRRSKKGNEYFDDAASAATSPATFSNEKESGNGTTERKGNMSSLFDVVRSASEISKNQDATDADQQDAGSNDVFEDSFETPRKKSKRKSKSKALSKDSPAPEDNDVFQEAQETPLPEEDNKSFLGERPEMPLTVETGASGPTTLPSAVTKEVESPSQEDFEANAARALSSIRSRSASPRFGERSVDLAAQPQSQSESPSTPGGTSLQQRRLSALQTSDLRSSPMSTSSPTAVPLMFRRPPLTPGHNRTGSTESPKLESPSTPQGIVRSRQPRPKSLEFRSSKEFRPLFLVEQHSYKKDPEPEETYPSLPSSRTSSAHPSFEDLREAAEREVAAARDSVGSSDYFGSQANRYSWGSAPRSKSPDYLNSQQTTPTQTEFPKEVRKERPKYEFHSPSELLEDPLLHHADQVSPMEIPDSAKSEDREVHEGSQRQLGPSLWETVGVGAAAGAAAAAIASVTYDKKVKSGDESETPSDVPFEKKFPGILEKAPEEVVNDRSTPKDVPTLGEHLSKQELDQFHGVPPPKKSKKQKRKEKKQQEQQASDLIFDDKLSDSQVKAPPDNEVAEMSRDTHDESQQRIFENTTALSKEEPVISMQEKAVGEFPTEKPGLSEDDPQRFTREPVEVIGDSLVMSGTQVVDATDRVQEDIQADLSAPNLEDTNDEHIKHQPAHAEIVEHAPATASAAQDSTIHQRDSMAAGDDDGVPNMLEGQAENDAMLKNSAELEQAPSAPAVTSQMGTDTPHIRWKSGSPTAKTMQYDPDTPPFALDERSADEINSAPEAIPLPETDDDDLQDAAPASPPEESPLDVAFERAKAVRGVPPDIDVDVKPETFATSSSHNMGIGEANMETKDQMAGKALESGLESDAEGLVQVVSSGPKNKRAKKGKKVTLDLNESFSNVALNGTDPLAPEDKNVPLQASTVSDKNRDQNIDVDSLKPTEGSSIDDVQGGGVSLEESPRETKAAVKTSAQAESVQSPQRNATNEALLAETMHDPLEKIAEQPTDNNNESPTDLTAPQEPTQDFLGASSKKSKRDKKKKRSSATAIEDTTTPAEVEPPTLDRSLSQDLRDEEDAAVEPDQEAVDKISMSSQPQPEAEAEEFLWAPAKKSKKDKKGKKDKRAAEDASAAESAPHVSEPVEAAAVDKAIPSASQNVLELTTKLQHDQLISADHSDPREVDSSTREQASSEEAAVRNSPSQIQESQPESAPEGTKEPEDDFSWAPTTKKGKGKKKKRETLDLYTGDPLSTFNEREKFSSEAPSASDSLPVPGRKESKKSKKNKKKLALSWSDDESSKPQDKEDQQTTTQVAVSPREGSNDVPLLEVESARELSEPSALEPQNFPLQELPVASADTPERREESVPTLESVDSAIEPRHFADTSSATVNSHAKLLQRTDEQSPQQEASERSLEQKPSSFNDEANQDALIAEESGDIKEQSQNDDLPPPAADAEDSFLEAPAKMSKKAKRDKKKQQQMVEEAETLRSQDELQSVNREHGVDDIARETPSTAEAVEQRSQTAANAGVTETIPKTADDDEFSWSAPRKGKKDKKKKNEKAAQNGTSSQDLPTSQEQPLDEPDTSFVEASENREPLIEPQKEPQADARELGEAAVSLEQQDFGADDSQWATTKISKRDKKKKKKQQMLDLSDPPSEYAARPENTEQAAKESQDTEVEPAASSEAKEQVVDLHDAPKLQSEHLSNAPEDQATIRDLPLTRPIEEEPEDVLWATPAKGKKGKKDKKKRASLAAETISKESARQASSEQTLFVGDEVKPTTVQEPEGVSNEVRQVHVSEAEPIDKNGPASDNVLVDEPATDQFVEKFGLEEKLEQQQLFANDHESREPHASTMLPSAIGTIETLGENQETTALDQLPKPQATKSMEFIGKDTERSTKAEQSVQGIEPATTPVNEPVPLETEEDKPSELKNQSTTAPADEEEDWSAWPISSKKSKKDKKKKRLLMPNNVATDELPSQSPSAVSEESSQAQDTQVMPAEPVEDMWTAAPWKGKKDKKKKKGTPMQLLDEASKSDSKDVSESQPAQLADNEISVEPRSETETRHLEEPTPPDETLVNTTAQIVAPEDDASPVQPREHPVQSSRDIETDVAHQPDAVEADKPSFENSEATDSLWPVQTKKAIKDKKKKKAAASVMADNETEPPVETTQDAALPIGEEVIPAEEEKEKPFQPEEAAMPDPDEAPEFSFPRKKSKKDKKRQQGIGLEEPIERQETELAKDVAITMPPKEAPIAEQTTEHAAEDVPWNAPSTKSKKQKKKAKSGFEDAFAQQEIPQAPGADNEPMEIKKQEPLGNGQINARDKKAHEDEEEDVWGIPAKKKKKDKKGKGRKGILLDSAISTQEPSRASSINETSTHKDAHDIQSDTQEAGPHIPTDTDRATPAADMTPETMMAEAVDDTTVDRETQQATPRYQDAQLAQHEAHMEDVLGRAPGAFPPEAPMTPALTPPIGEAHPRSPVTEEERARGKHNPLEIEDTTAAKVEASSLDAPKSITASEEEGMAQVLEAEESKDRKRKKGKKSRKWSAMDDFNPEGESNGVERKHAKKGAETSAEDLAMSVAAGLGFAGAARSLSRSRKTNSEPEQDPEDPREFGLSHRISWTSSPRGSPPPRSKRSSPVQRDNRDSALQMIDSPTVKETHYEPVRDSGYVASPVVPIERGGADFQELNTQVTPARPLRPITPTSSTEDLRQERRRSLHSRKSMEPEFSQSVSRSLEEPIPADIPPSPPTEKHDESFRDTFRDLPETPARRPTPVDSTSKDRSSGLFDSSPSGRTPGSIKTNHKSQAHLQSPSNGLHRSPSIHGRKSSERLHDEFGDRPGSPLRLDSTSQGPVLGVPDFSGGVTTHDSSRSMSPKSKSLGTIPEDDFAHDRGLSRAHGGRKSNENYPPHDTDRAITDSALTDRPWPKIDDVHESVSFSPQTEELPRDPQLDSRDPSKKSAKTLGERRSSPTSAKPSDLDLHSSPAIKPSNDKEKEKDRRMADVYDGWGAAPGSPMSPTRPPSMRKRQSMQQIQDLEARLEQMAAENRMLATAKITAEKSLEDFHFSQSRAESASREAVETRDVRIREKDADIAQLRESLEYLQEEVKRLTEINAGLNATNAAMEAAHLKRYSEMEMEHNRASQTWHESSRELENLREQHTQLSAGMEDVVRHEIQTAVADRDAEISRLQGDLELAKEKIRDLQQQILSSARSDDILSVKDEDYFEHACEQLCQRVQLWVVKFSKLSDTRVCRLTSEVRDEKYVDRFENTMLDDHDVNKYLADRVKRRDVFMSVVMMMIWEYIFTRYLFGMDREQRQKLKSLEKQLGEVGPPRAVRRWRALTLTLLTQRESFKEQRASDNEGVVQEIFKTLSKFLPPSSSVEGQLTESLRNVIRSAIDLSIEMRTQRAEYIMLPPHQPEYDENGDLARLVYFNAALMNERSGDTVSNEDLEAQQAVVRMVLFPPVFKKGSDTGDGDEEIVVCPAQVLVARQSKDKKVVRIQSGDGMSIDAGRSVHSVAPSSMDMGNVI